MTHCFPYRMHYLHSHIIYMHKGSSSFISSPILVVFCFIHLFKNKHSSNIYYAKLYTWQKLGLPRLLSCSLPALRNKGRF